MDLPPVTTEHPRKPSGDQHSRITQAASSMAPDHGDPGGRGERPEGMANLRVQVDMRHRTAHFIKSLLQRLLPSQSQGRHRADAT